MRRIGLLVLLLAVGSLTAPVGSVLAQEPLSDTESIAPFDAAPVVIDGMELFTLRGIRSYPAEQRAAQVEARIRTLARNPGFDPASLKIVDTARGAEILGGDEVISLVTVIDAEADGIPPHLLAEVHMGAIRYAITRYREARMRGALVDGAWRAMLATLSLVVLLTGVRRGVSILDRWLGRSYVGRMKGVSIKSFVILGAERVRAMVRALMRLAGGLAVLVLVVLYFRYTLSLFPWTLGAATELRRGVLAPVEILAAGLLRELPHLLFLVVLFLVVRWILRLLRAFFAAVGRGDVGSGDFDPAWAQPTFAIVRVAVIVLALVVAYPYIPGSSSEAFKGISVFLGVVLSLGSSSVIANILAGYSLIYRRAFSEGDLVKIGDTIGFVTRSRLNATYLRSPKNEQIVVPNSRIEGTEVINYSALARSHGLVLHTTVGIGYETPWRQVEAMLIEAARRTPGVQAEPAPFVHQLALGDFAVTYELNVHIDDPQSMRLLYTRLHREILDVFNEYGVQIMTPNYEADTPVPKVVGRDQWYLAPAVKEAAPLPGETEEGEAPGEAPGDPRERSAGR